MRAIPSSISGCKPRRKTRRIFVGRVPVGGGAPVSVQTMTKTDTRDVRATVAQIREVKQLGCDIVRLAVPDEEAARALAKIVKLAGMPVIADIHFDHKLAMIALEGGVDGLRINPGNIGSREKVREVVRAARERKVPIRIGVNSGSVEKEAAEKYGAGTADALVASAVKHVRILEDLDYREIKISVKASDVRRTLEAYRKLSVQTDYPLHLGVTEAGTFLAGTVRSSVALGILIEEGIGDTIRVSLTDTPAREVRVGLELLRSLGLRRSGPAVTSCPTCGRIQVNVVEVANRVEEALEKYYTLNPGALMPSVAVMGCMVNGPGEAKHADVAIAGGVKKFALYVGGKLLKTVREEDAVEEVLKQVRKWRD
ncbi:MAG: 4-hydroxy-3-methylbut-2-en-1-yl diphosphate synthase [Verrucomicrobia bacterium]|nr:4-hydroxy-3-methylbut-2-en-1-yl diphosphate synthase [Verrucomicrobiota bacterium]